MRNIEFATALRSQAVGLVVMLSMVSALEFCEADQLARSSPSADWPRFLGPDGNGVSLDETPLADSWPESGPTEVWSVPIEPGHGGASIVDGKVHVMDRVDSEKDVLKIFDLETGKVLGTTELESPGRVNFPGARTVPTVTRDHIFTGGPLGVFAGWDRKSLRKLWQLDAIGEMGGEPLFFGYSGHPQVHGDLVILGIHNNKASVIAIRADTGEVVWKTPGLLGSLSSPIIRRFQGRDQVLFIGNETPEDPKKTANPMVAGLDPDTGEILWQYTGFPEKVPVVPPMVIGENTIFVTGGYKAGAQLLRVGDGPKPKVEMIQSYPRGSQICPPIVHQGHIYTLTAENETVKKNGMPEDSGLICISVDGKQLWNTGSEPMFGRGSMILADGKLIIRDTFYGKLYLVKPSPEGYKQLAVANPFGHKRSNLKVWAPLAISKGLLIIRDEREIKCLDLRKK